MRILKDRFWIWGQSAGAHHAVMDNYFRLPGVNVMTPLEGADYLGVPNCCRVVMNNHPKAPFDDESSDLSSMKNVVWSVLGASGSNENGLDLQEVLRQADIFPNISAAVLDDFFTEKDSTPRMSLKQLKDVHRRLGKNVRPLDLWIVVYDYQLKNPVAEYLKECDVVTFWTWKGSELVNMDRNFELLKNMTPGKRRLAGCYMWNYGESKPLTVNDMKFQCGKYLNWIQNGDIEGIIFCSNCICDLDLDTVEWTKNWIKEIGNKEI